MTPGGPPTARLSRPSGAAVAAGVLSLAISAAALMFAPPPIESAGGRTTGSAGDATPRGVTPEQAPTGSGYLIADLEALPTSGPAWEALVDVADAGLGRADLTDQDSRHAVRTLANALVAARTGDAEYRERARQAILAAPGTEREGAYNSVLALGRQLGAYVMAADLIGLDDPGFRDWLTEIRTRELGGHGRWRSLSATHEDSANNWGAFAGASRIAASLYLGDTADVERAAAVLRGFLGDREAWSAWQPLSRRNASWSCEPERYTPVNPPCVLEGIDVDGAIVRDISRGGALGWPPPEEGVQYTQEALQGLIVQAELLHRAGYDTWEWSDRALSRAARFVTRAEGWNPWEVAYHVPWLLNARYELDLPTRPAGYGRLFGFTDWLYGER